MSIDKYSLFSYVLKQVNTFFPDKNKVVKDNQLTKAFEKALSRLEYCFSHISDPLYSTLDENGIEHPFFQHTNSDQYCIFLYYFSNSLWKMYPTKKDVCDKLILLNKTLHGCWFTYKVELPDIFYVSHPVGSVIGHAIYRNFLVICQNVTIGERIDTKEEIGEYCFLSTGATIIGNERIGKDVSIGVNTTIFRETIPDNSVVYIDRKTGSRVIKQLKRNSRAHLCFK